MSLKSLFLLFLLFASASFATLTEDAQTNTLGSSTTDTGGAGVNFTANVAANLTAITKHASATPTIAHIYLTNGTEVANASFSGDYANFSPSYPIVAGTQYTIKCDAAGSPYTRRYTAGASWPVAGTNVNFTGYSDGAYNSYADCVISVWSDVAPVAAANTSYMLITAAAANAYETANATLYVNFTTNFNITEINYTITYNNTAINVSNLTGLNTNLLQATFPITAPLVASNLTNMSISVAGYALVGGNQTDNTTTANHTVLLWYDAAGFALSRNTSTVEAGTPVNTTFPSIPSGALAAISLDGYFYSMPFCLNGYANGTYHNTTCTNRTMTTAGNASNTLSSAHLYSNGLTFTDVFMQKAFNISFNYSAMSRSAKNLTATDNTTREYYMWLVNSSNGSINGTLAAANLTTLFNITFYDESSLTALTVNSATALYTLSFSDGAQKTFSVYQANTNTFLVRAYPNATTQNLSSAEVFSATNYTTRSHFINGQLTPFSTQQDYSIYLFPTSGSTYALIYVLRNANPVPNAYVTIQKYYATGGGFLNLGQVITDSSGVAGLFVDLAGWYKFYVYASNGTLLYSSSSLQQFVCSSSPCRITIDIASLNQTMASPITGEMWQDVNYSILPLSYYVNTPTNITFGVYSKSASLSYWGLNVTRMWNSSNRTLFCTGNFTTSAGGTAYCTINDSGMYYITGWFKHSSYAEYKTGVKGIQYLNSSFSFEKVREDFATNPPIGGWTYYFVAVVMAMIAGGFVSRYTIDGAGLVGLAVLWVFTLLNPNAELVCIVGDSCITTMHATVLTSFAVVAALYLVWRGN